MDNNRKLNYCDLDFIDYNVAWDLQKKILNLRVDNKINDILFLLEHPHTYTLGKVADKKNLIGSKEYLEKKKISVYDIDRGGDITYHGPGQIVGYPIIDLKKWKMDTHKYLRALEEVIIKTCAEYGVKGIRDPKYTGVWIENRKIAAIGIKVSKWVTMHGFAFNINTDLDFFTGIIPCGITDKAVTSLSKETNKKISVNEVKEKLVNNFKEIFEYHEATALSKDELLAVNL
ncbi:MAG TPA: lipoyl(octanoyl) transferase LipB [Ignavibacteriaceae bacterium]|nr:lipoyl(octanoyl) transferase LipB [Ignavibacteriaceae bacterium]